MGELRWTSEWQSWRVQRFQGGEAMSLIVTSKETSNKHGPDTGCCRNCLGIRNIIISWMSWWTRKSIHGRQVSLFIKQIIGRWGDRHGTHILRWLRTNHTPYKSHPLLLSVGGSWNLFVTSRTWQRWWTVPPLKRLHYRHISFHCPCFII